MLSTKKSSHRNISHVKWKDFSQKDFSGLISLLVVTREDIT